MADPVSVLVLLATSLHDFDSPPLTSVFVGGFSQSHTPIAAALDRRRERRDPTSPLVFHRDGIPVRRWRTAWRTACQAAGVPTRFLHDCRRTAARDLIRASVPERVAMLLTGHKSRAIFDRYNIIHEQELLDAGDQLVAYLAPQAQATPARQRSHAVGQAAAGHGHALDGSSSATRGGASVRSTFRSHGAPSRTSSTSFRGGWAVAGNVKAKPMDRITTANLREMMRDSISVNARIMTNELAAYTGAAAAFVSHGRVRHGTGEYARGEIHTNTVEGFFSLPAARHQ